MVENKVFVIQGEISVLLGALRPGNKWSSSSIHDYELNPLVVSLKNLRELLVKAPSTSDYDVTSVFGPFLEVVKAENTSGPVTEIALSSIAKFITYGLVDPSNGSASVAVENIALGVTHARFVGTDSGSDEVVLMKVLQVLRCLLMSPCGSLLSNDSVCEMMQSCFRICLEERVSELLRRGAESILADMVHLLFSKIPEYPAETRLSKSTKKLKTKGGRDDKHSRKSRSPKSRSQTLPFSQSGDRSPSGTRPRSSSTDESRQPPQSCCDLGSKNDLVANLALQSEAGDEECSFSVPVAESTQAHISISRSMSDGDSVPRLDDGMVQSQSDIQSNMNSATSEIASEGCGESTINTTIMSESILSSPDSEIKQDFINPRGVRFTHVAASLEGEGIIAPYGLPSVSELLRFLVTLINPYDKNNTDAMITVGLRLITVAVESGVDHIGNVDSLLEIVKDDLFRNLFALLVKDRSSIVIDAMRICYLLIESQRKHLKLQLEMYITKLAELVNSTNPRFTVERREVALDGMVQVWKLPGVVTELYLNFDCDINNPNLFESIVEILQKNAVPGPELLPINVLAYSALSYVIDEIELRCHQRIVNQPQSTPDEVPGISPLSLNPVGTPNADLPEKDRRMRVSSKLPTHEEILATKHKKQILTSGSEKFNERPTKGIEFLQAEELLATPLDPAEVAQFLRENPRLEKKMIGEYISNRKNLAVLEAFVKSFNFSKKRIDESLRLYLEAFRLPGEAPLIQILMEMFAEHWHKSNGEPFSNSGVAFTLAYAVIMLNTDQHNNNAKKQNVPMTEDEFKRNLRGCNEGVNFDQDMLGEIYHAIKTDEIVMPAEQTGLVKENYLWKVLLRRGATQDGSYIHAPSGMLDRDLFQLLARGPIIQTLTILWERMNEEKALQKIMSGFRKCVMIAAHYNTTDTVDSYLNALSKFTIVSTPSENSYIAAVFGSKLKAQLALRTLFILTHRYGDTIREAWKSICGCLLGLYKANLLPEQLVEVEDILEGRIKLEKKRPVLQKQEAGLFSSLYSIIAAASEYDRVPTQEELECIDAAKDCVNECGVVQLVEDSKFLRGDALVELVKAIIEHSPLPEGPGVAGQDESVTVFFLELLARITTQNRDRALLVFPAVRDHFHSLIVGGSTANHYYLLDRSTNALLRLATRLLTKDDLVPSVLKSLRIFLLLKATSIERISKYIVSGLHELLKTGAASITDPTDWATLLTLLECAGAGAKLPTVIGSQENASDSASDPGAQRVPEAGQESDRGYTSDSELYTAEPKHIPLHHGKSTPDLSTSPKRTNGGWIVVGKEGEIEAHRVPSIPANVYTLDLARELYHHQPNNFIKATEVLSYIIRESGSVSLNNYENLVQCTRVFVEASMLGCGKSKRSGTAKANRKVQRTRSYNSDYDADESDGEELPSAYSQIPLQLIEVLYGLYSRICEMSRADADTWEKGLCPILQGIGRLCCDSRKNVRTIAITYLQRALLMPDLQDLEAPQWESCFTHVLFPLLAKLLEVQNQAEFGSVEETRMRASTLLSKVFLQHLTTLLTLSTFTALWLMILDFMEKYMRTGSDLLGEAIPESMKNMLLVMETAGVFQTGSDQLLTVTWDKIETFLPGLRDELIRSKQPSVRIIESGPKLESTPTPINKPISELSTTLDMTSPNTPGSTIVETPCSTHPKFESTVLSPPELSPLPDSPGVDSSQVLRSQSPLSLSDYFQGTSPIRILPVLRDPFSADNTSKLAASVSVDSSNATALSDQLNRGLVLSSPNLPEQGSTFAFPESVAASEMPAPVVMSLENSEEGIGSSLITPDQNSQSAI